jgi:hypothetical protein
MHQAGRFSQFFLGTEQKAASGAEAAEDGRRRSGTDRIAGALISPWTKNALVMAKGP